MPRTSFNWAFFASFQLKATNYSKVEGTQIGVNTETDPPSCCKALKRPMNITA